MESRGNHDSGLDDQGRAQRRRDPLDELRVREVEDGELALGGGVALAGRDRPHLSRILHAVLYHLAVGLRGRLGRGGDGLAGLRVMEDDLVGDLDERAADILFQT